MKQNSEQYTIEKLIPGYTVKDGGWDEIDVGTHCYYDVNYEYRGEVFDHAIVNYIDGWIQFDKLGETQTDELGHEARAIIKSVSFPLKMSIDFDNPTEYNQDA